MNKRSWIVRKRLSLIFQWLSRYPMVSRKLVVLVALWRWLARGGRYAAPDFQTEKNLFDNDRFIYVANPKVATRSLLSFLDRNYSDLRVVRQNFERLAVQHDLSSMQAITFVRNPWARVYSCWRDKISNQVGMADISIITRFRGLYPDMPFRDFVYWLMTEEGSDAYADRHWMSQSLLLNLNNGKPHYTFIGKLEQIDQDFEKVAELLGVGSGELGHLNSTSDSHNETDKKQIYHSVYDVELIELVGQRYHSDIVRFNYSFE